MLTEEGSTVVSGRAHKALGPRQDLSEGKIPNIDNKNYLKRLFILGILPWSHNLSGCKYIFLSKLSLCSSTPFENTLAVLMHKGYYIHAI